MAGGWAIDLFVGRQTREHRDLDIQVLRRDQAAVRAALHRWDIYAVDPPGALRPWRSGEVLPGHVHDIWCRRAPDAPWALQLMLLDTERGRWVCRRDRRVGGPVCRFGRRDGAGVPYVAPEVQLLFKAREPRPQDEEDFAVALLRLDAAARRWLGAALGIVSPDHPWLPRLRG